MAWILAVGPVHRSLLGFCSPTSRRLGLRSRISSTGGVKLRRCANCVMPAVALMEMAIFKISGCFLFCFVVAPGGGGGAGGLLAPVKGEGSVTHALSGW